MMNTPMARVAAFFALGSAMFAASADVRLPTGTPVYLETQSEIVARKRDYSVGDTIDVKVWRDVVLDGQVVIRGGTRATLRVDSIKGRGIVGRKGKVKLGAVATTTVDGQRVNLSGGYGKEGRGRVAMTATVGALLFFPVLFVPGGVPKFPAGTIIDAYVDGGYLVDTPDQQRPVISLAGVNGFTAEIDYDRFTSQEKPTHFDLLLTNAPSGALVVDNVNGRPVPAIDLERSGAGNARVSLKALSKHFQKGINRFEIAAGSGGARNGTEVIVEIQM